MTIAAVSEGAWSSSLKPHPLCHGARFLKDATMTDTLIRLSTERCRIDRLAPDDAAALAAITDASVTEQVHFLPESFAEARSEEHTSELQSLMRNSYAVFCWKKKKTNTNITITSP